MRYDVPGLKPMPFERRPSATSTRNLLDEVLNANLRTA